MKRICLMIMLLALLLTGCKNPEPTTVATISPGPVSVTVNSVDEFLASLGHNTEIILEAGYYDLTTASDYGQETGSPYYTWVDVGDGYQLLIQNAVRKIRNWCTLPGMPTYWRFRTVQMCFWVSLLLAIPMAVNVSAA